MPRHEHLLIRNAQIVSPESIFTGDIHVRDAKIASITATGSLAEGARIIDAGGRLVTPGGVDSHCHVGFLSGETATLDSYESTSRAALLGGTTTIVDFAIPEGVETMTDAFERQLRAGESSFCDFSLHLGVTYWSAKAREELLTLAKQGVATVKMFTTNRGDTMVNSDTILSVLQTVKEFGGLCFIHCEDNSIIEAAGNAAGSTGETSAAHHHEMRPEIAEVAAVEHILRLAEYAEAPVYLVHLSLSQSVRSLVEAKQRGVRAHGEALTHHMLLDEEMYASEQPEKYLCAPPLRPEEQVSELRRATTNGGISTIASDHCDFGLSQKLPYCSDVRQAPNGLPGVQLRLPLVMTHLAQTGEMTPQRFVELTATNPAKLNGLFPKKGIIQPGSDADLVIWDELDPETIAPQQLAMMSDFSAFEGWQLRARARYVISAGVPLVEDGLFVAETPAGKFQPGVSVDSDWW